MGIIRTKKKKYNYFHLIIKTNTFIISIFKKYIKRMLRVSKKHSNLIYKMGLIGDCEERPPIYEKGKIFKILEKFDPTDLLPWDKTLSIMHDESELGKVSTD